MYIYINNHALLPIRDMQMIQKLSTRMPSHETRLKVLKEIAKENDIVLQLEESTTDLEEATKVRIVVTKPNAGLN